MFDMIVGTSIGGATALFLSQYKQHSIHDTFTQMTNYDVVKNIAPKSLWDRLAGSIQTCPIYNGAGKRNTFANFLKVKKMKDLAIPCAVTTYNLKESDPRVFCSWEEKDGDYDPLLLAQATTAAPTYFPPVKIDNEWHADGGIACNNPSAIAYSLAKEYFEENSDIKILSIGTGKYDGCWNDHDDLDGWGPPAWVFNGLIDMLISAPGQAVTMNMEELLEEKFFRLNCTEIDNIKIDDITRCNVQKLKDAADNLFEANKDRITEFLK
jgi:patatin-like phospholipase/acyl hydrolase